METKDVSLTISKDIVQPIVEAKIKEAMVKCFSDNPDGLIGEMIDKFMSQKVNSEGTLSGYSSENNYFYIDVVLRNMVNEALRGAVKSWVEENQDLIRTAVYEKLNQKSMMKKMSGQIISGLIEATKNQWSFKTDFKFQTDKD